MRKKIIILTAICLSVLSYTLFINFKKDISNFPSQSMQVKYVSIGQKQFKTILADTPKAQIKGLGGRSSILPNEVMLFTFPSSGYHGIWMKDMEFPIDILWIDKGHRVVDMKEEVQPLTFPEIFTPNSSAMYVLEAESGFAKKNDVKIGDIVNFSESF